jgi:glutamate:Na+ symporter, ESS family
MQTPFSFDLILVFGFLSAFLMLGILLRAKIGFLQRFIIPSCLIGGFLGLIFINVVPLGLDIKLFEAFIYHLFSISFISVGLTAFAEDDTESPNDSGSGAKVILRGALWGGLIQGITIPSQAIVGCLLVFLFGFLGMELFPTFGLFAPLGFTQGPGQALSFGKVWEGFGFEHAATIGLIFAAIGFGFAFFVGVPMVNWGIKKAWGSEKALKLPEAFVKGYFPRHAKKESAGNQSTHSSNVDALAFQTGLVGMVYLMTFGFVKVLNLLMSETVAKLIWGFVFFAGLLVALFTGWVLKKIGVVFLIDKRLQKRITGWAIDFLIIATIMAIKPAIVVQYIIPIVVISLSSGIVTTGILIYFGNRLDAHNLQRMVLSYGICTGTLSSGLLLLRMTDPDFESPVAIEAGIMALFAAPIVVPSMVVLNAKFLFGWEIYHIMLVFLGIMLVSMALLRFTKLWGKPKF